MEKKGWKVLAIIFIMLFGVASVVAFLYMIKASINETNLEACIDENFDCGSWCFNFTHENCLNYFCYDYYNCENVTEWLEAENLCLDILSKYA